MSVTGSPHFAKDAPPSAFKGGFMRRGGSARNSWVESLDWDSDFGIALRQYYALQLEAKETVKESQQAWLDTEFSRVALSCECCGREGILETHGLLRSVLSSSIPRGDPITPRAFSEDIHPLASRAPGPEAEVPSQQSSLALPKMWSRSDRDGGGCDGVWSSPPNPQ